jgi:hypothetical protein
MNANPNVKWELCNATLMKNYVRDEEGSFTTYEKLLRDEYILSEYNLKIVK